MLTCYQGDLDKNRLKQINKVFRNYRTNKCIKGFVLDNKNVCENFCVTVLSLLTVVVKF